MKNVISIFLASMLLVSALVFPSCTDNNPSNLPVSVEKGMFVPAAGGLVTKTQNDGYWITPVLPYRLALGDTVAINDVAEIGYDLWHTWTEAANFVDTLNYLGFNDWQLPDTTVLNCVNHPTPGTNQGSEIWSNITQRAIRQWTCASDYFQIYQGTGANGLTHKSYVSIVRFVHYQ